VRSARASARHTRDFILRRLLAAADAAGIACGVLVGFIIVGNAGAGSAVPGLATLPGWILLFKLYGLYDGDAKRISHSTVDDTARLFHAMLIGGLALWAIYRGLTSYDFFFNEVISFGLIGFGGVLALRAVARFAATRLASPERLLIVGGGPTAEVLLRKIQSHPEYALEPIGYLDDGDDLDENVGELPRLGDITRFAEICSTLAIDRVVIIAKALATDAPMALVRDTRGLDLRISLLPHGSDVLGPAVELDHIEGLAVLGINPPALTRSSRLIKRVTDVVLAGTALLLAMPVLVVAICAIKLTSRGPAFYVQRRVGYGGRVFGMRKLRTMVADADQRVADLIPKSKQTAWLDIEDDPRITPVGRFLRRTSIDELPQLWNVVIGDMSLVGPRPMTPEIYAHIDEWGRRRLDLTPGITGLWQVLGRTSIPFEEMVRLDYLYVTNWSLWEDARLLLRTLPAVLFRRGAN
jgi:exopolysaccharide biosynthesis polyprenyl glycosylphosphotransferase